MCFSVWSGAIQPRCIVCIVGLGGSPGFWDMKSAAYYSPELLNSLSSSSSVGPHVTMFFLGEFSLCIRMWSRLWEDVHVCLRRCVCVFLSDAQLPNFRQAAD